MAKGRSSARTSRGGGAGAETTAERGQRTAIRERQFRTQARAEQGFAALTARAATARQQVVFARERLQRADVAVRNQIPGTARHATALRDRNRVNRELNQAILNMNRLERQRRGR